MNYSTEQIVNGIIKYADNEVMNKLPTTGKWIMGTGIGLASSKARNIANNLQDNGMVKALGIVDDEGNFDIESLASSLKDSAKKYGNAIFDIPFVGKLSFNDSDIEILKEYIERGV